MNKKMLSLAAALILLLGITTGTTLAWFTDKTQDVKNTFTVGNIDITLTEPITDEADEEELLELFKMIPGYTIDKDPTVTVLGGSEKCWLFVKVEQSDNFDDYMVYAIDDEEKGTTETTNKWTALAGEEGVYYRIVDQQETDISFAVLEGDQVQVKPEVTKAMMDVFYTVDASGKPVVDTTKLPTLTFTAYASQYMKNNTEAFAPAEAWANVQSNGVPAP